MNGSVDEREREEIMLHKEEGLLRNGRGHHQRTRKIKMSGALSLNEVEAGGGGKKYGSEFI